MIKCLFTISFGLVFFGLNNFAYATNELSPTPEESRKCRSKWYWNDRVVPENTKQDLFRNCVFLERARVEQRRASDNVEAARSNSELAGCIKRELRGDRNFFQNLFARKSDEERIAAENKCTDNLTRARENLTQAENTLTQTDESLSAAQAAHQSLWDSAKADQQAARLMSANVNNEFLNMRLSVLELLRMNDRSAEKLDKIAAAIDYSALGIYMRDRMASVLSSKATCTAVKACVANPEAPATIKGADLNSAFSGKINMKPSEVPKPAPVKTNESSVAN